MLFLFNIANTHSRKKVLELDMMRFGSKQSNQMKFKEKLFLKRYGIFWRFFSLNSPSS